MNPQMQPIDPTSLPRPVNPITAVPEPSQPITPNESAAQVDAMHGTSQAIVPQGANMSAHSPSIAEDVDLIEKEWVEKAKHIVSTTRDDPSEQNLEISKLKADYMKKRYNKDLDIDAGQAK